MPRRRGRLLSRTLAEPGRLARERRNRHRIMSFGTATLVGLVVSWLAPSWLSGATRFVASYDAGVATLLGFFWMAGLRGDAQVTRERAALEDEGRNLILLVILGAVVVGLISAIAIVGHGPHVKNAVEKWEAYGFGILAIALGWFLVHTLYTFRYAHLYWFDANADGNPGGISFPGTPMPSDWDFAYFSFVIGTSFAVSDPQITSTEIRREVMFHSIIAFAYNSVIVGMVINLFAGIFSAPSSSNS